MDKNYMTIIWIGLGIGLLAALYGIIFALSSGSKSRAQLVDEIKQQEKRLASDSIAIKNVHPQLVDLYEEFGHLFPKDTLAPQYKFKAIELYKFRGKFKKSIRKLDSLQLQYPDHKKNPYWLFLQGFIYENNLNNLKKAREKYKSFLEQFPDHQLVKDVKFSLENLGKSPEEIIDAIENKGESADTTTAQR